MKMKFLSVITLISISLGVAKASVIAAHAVKKGTQIIGGSFHGELNYFKDGQRCLKVNEHLNIEQVRNDSASVVTFSKLNYSEISKEFRSTIGLSARMETGEGVSLKREFLKNSKESDNSITFIYKTELNTGHVLLKDPIELNDIGKKLAQKGPEHFFKYCGDQFVYKISKGAKAFVTVKILLKDKAEKEKVSYELVADASEILSLEANFEKVKKKLNIAGKVKVYAIQEGGFAARINSIFGSGSGISSCNSPDLENCELTIKDVLNYFAVDFPRQFDHFYRDYLGSGYIQLPNTAKTLFYHTKSYCQLPAHLIPETLDCSTPEDLEENMEFLRQKKTDWQVNLNWAEQVINSKEPFLEKDFLRRLHLYIEDLNKNIQIIDSSLIECEIAPLSCKTLKNNLTHFLRPIEELDQKSIKIVDRVKICVETGPGAVFGNIIMKAKKDFQTLETLDPRPLLMNPGSTNCHEYKGKQLFEANSLWVKINPLVTSEDLKCNKKRKKKWAHILDVNFTQITMENLKTKETKTFPGHHFKSRKKCHNVDDELKGPRWVNLSLSN